MAVNSEEDEDEDEVVVLADDEMSKLGSLFISTSLLAIKTCLIRLTTASKVVLPVLTPLSAAVGM